MNSKLKFKVYRGVVLTNNFINETKNEVREFTYRGTKFLRKATEQAINPTTKRMYRGFAC